MSIKFLKFWVINEIMWVRWVLLGYIKEDENNFLINGWCSWIGFVLIVRFFRVGVLDLIFVRFFLRLFIWFFKKDWIWGNVVVGKLFIWNFLENFWKIFGVKILKKCYFNIWVYKVKLVYEIKFEVLLLGVVVF